MACDFSGLFFVLIEVQGRPARLTSIFSTFADSDTITHLMSQPTLNLSPYLRILMAALFTAAGGKGRARMLPVCPACPGANMKPNEHFETAVDWEAAARLVDFAPRRPAFTAGFDLVSLAVYVMDHRKRRLPLGARSLEAHYGAFVIDQKRLASATDAKRQALSTPYGPTAETVRVGGFEGRGYELGPEPAPDDTDGRSPAVIVWNDGAMLYLVASSQLDEDTLLRIASSLYV